MAKRNPLVTEWTATYRAVVDPLRDRAESDKPLAQLIARADALCELEPVNSAVLGGADRDKLHRQLFACIVFAFDCGLIDAKTAQFLHDARSAARERARLRMIDVSSTEIQRAVRSGKYGAPILSDLIVKGGVA